MSTWVEGEVERLPADFEHPDTRAVTRVHSGTVRLREALGAHFVSVL